MQNLAKYVSKNYLAGFFLTQKKLDSIAQKEHHF
jgi:hypothetical protein